MDDRREQHFLDVIAGQIEQVRSQRTACQQALDRELAAAATAGVRAAALRREPAIVPDWVVEYPTMAAFISPTTSSAKSSSTAATPSTPSTPNATADGSSSNSNASATKSPSNPYQRPPDRHRYRHPKTAKEAVRLRLSNPKALPLPQGYFPPS